MITATRYHDLSFGHRVTGHESKCAMLHGHNYRIHFTVAAAHYLKELDEVGRVVDFSVINSTLCAWVEREWDHRFLAWEQDPLMKALMGTAMLAPDDAYLLKSSVVWTPFNPTAENLALHLLRDVGPKLLVGRGLALINVKVEETRKCSAEVSYGDF